MKQETWNGRNKIKTFCDALFDVLPDTLPKMWNKKKRKNRVEKKIFRENNARRHRYNFISSKHTTSQC